MKQIINIIIKIIFTLKGISYGKNCEFLSYPYIENLKKQNLKIGDNVKIGKNVEFLFRENGKIFINNYTKIDSSVRMLSANNASLIVGENSKIGKNTIINAGENVTIGKNCLISGNNYIQTSSHKYNKNKLINQQGYSHGEIIINDDCWIGANSIILHSVTLSQGTVVGALSLVNENTKPYSINFGIPSKFYKFRE
tara:strand:+ start:886 stop:1473 length:588 start_codon:yes stop_codon:yes gene_type:complete